MNTHLKINIMKTLNPYTISWAILEPLKGVATKSDCKKISIFSRGVRQKLIFIHESNKADLLSKLNEFKGKLKKSYKVTIITDKQFSLLNGRNYLEVATKKQIKEQFVIN